MLALAQLVISVLAWRIPRRAVASLLKWSVVAAPLYVLTPAMARAGGIETDTGLLSPPIVDNKPVNVKTGLFLTNLIDVGLLPENTRILR
jgi:hypothetical protein